MRWRNAVITLLGAVALAACTSGGSSTGDTAASPAGRPAARQACRAVFTPRPLPAWANAGFHPPTQPMPFVLGDNGDIIAILWADHDPLLAPPAAERNNKILWVSRVRGSVDARLRIHASLNGTGQRATRTVDGGPGPSIIDLPAPGCWSLSLSWGEHHDHLQLEYVSG
jgi:hypothetical protein